MAQIRLNYTASDINKLLDRIDGLYELVVSDSEFDSLLNGYFVSFSSNNINLSDIKIIGLALKVRNMFFTVDEYDDTTVILSNIYHDKNASISSIGDENATLGIRKLELENSTGQIVAKLNMAKILIPNASGLIGRNNTEAFIPTSDYQPATKKYVDDQILNNSNSVTTTTSSASSNKIILGKYIIRFNEEDQSLDFIYTNEEILDVKFEVGSFNTNTGITENSNTAIRNTDYIEVEDGYDYIIAFSKPANNFAYYLYDSSKNFISCSTETNVESGVSTVVKITNNTAFIRFKFCATTLVIEDAFKLVDYVDVSKSIGEVIEVEYEAGEFYDDGTEEPNTVTIRNVGYIPLEQGYEYTISFGEEIRYFRYHFYDSAHNFLSRSESMDLVAGKTVHIDNSNENNAYMRFKFGALDDNQEHAFRIAETIEIRKTVK